MKDVVKRLPDSELEVMQVIWSLEAPVPRSLLEEEMKKVHVIAQTTLLTLLTRLSNKGFIKIEKKGRSSVYTPLVKKEDYLAKQSKQFIDQLCGGKISVFASALCDGGLSKEDIEELRRLLEEDAL